MSFDYFKEIIERLTRVESQNENIIDNQKVCEDKIDELKAHVNDEVEKLTKVVNCNTKTITEVKHQKATESAVWSAQKKIVVFFLGAICTGSLGLFFAWVSSILFG